MKEESLEASDNTPMYNPQGLPLKADRLGICLAFLKEVRMGFNRVDERGREIRSTMNPLYCIRNTGNSQNLYRATPILFGAPHVPNRSP